MRIALLVTACLIAAEIRAEDLTLENVSKLPRNSADEPIAANFSLTKAVQFLDHAALDWTRRRKCFTCHTNFAYLMARPMVDGKSAPHQQVRSKLEALVKTRWQNEGPRWDAEVVMAAAVLAINDSLTTGALSASTRQALDRMWTLQRDDGGFDWLKCDWPPMEIDDDYGVAIAAMAVGAAPDAYAETELARRGLAKLRNYLQANPSPTLHHDAMWIWADSYRGGLVTDQQRSRTVRQLQSLQKEDGGWSAATLAEWKRADDSEQDVDHSDAYGTALVVFALLRSGVHASDPAIEQGIAWLKSNQRQSGRWFSRSLYKDSTHYLSHAASAMAVMAIQTADSAR